MHRNSPVCRFLPGLAERSLNPILILPQAAWQHPYVNVFRLCRVDDWRDALAEGDVSLTLVRLHTSLFWLYKHTLHAVDGIGPCAFEFSRPDLNPQLCNAGARAWQEGLHDQRCD